MSLSLSELLGLKAAPTNILAWHTQVSEGLPFRALRILARELGATEAELGVWLGLNTQTLNRRRTAKAFNAVESDRLHRLARAYRALLVPLLDGPAAAEWLKTANPALRDCLPMELLRTTLGSELVMTAIARIEPVDKTRVYQDAPDFEEGVRVEDGENPHDALWGNDEETDEWDDEEGEFTGELPRVR